VCGLDPIDSGWDSVADLYEHGIEVLGSIKTENF